jgi:hypothetical protein
LISWINGLIAQLCSPRDVGLGKNDSPLVSFLHNLLPTTSILHTLMHTVVVNKIFYQQKHKKEIIKTIIENMK